MERSMVQRIGDVEQMVTSFTRHLRAENKASQTITACARSSWPRSSPKRDAGRRGEHPSGARRGVPRRSPQPAQRRDREQPLPRTRRVLRLARGGGRGRLLPPARMKPPSIPEQPVPVPTAKDIQAILSSPSSWRLASSASRIPESANSRMIAVSRRASNPLPSQPLMVRTSTSTRAWPGPGKVRRFRTASFGSRTAKALASVLAS
jgi:hypothetical protein